MSNTITGNIPEKLILMTIEDSYRNCAIDYKSTRGLQYNRKRMMNTVYDDFTRTSNIVFADELLVDNTGAKVKITDRQASSDRNKSIHIIMCDVEFNGEHRVLPLESNSLLSIISKGSVHNGVIDDKIVFAIYNGTIYPYTVSDIEQTKNSSKCDSTDNATTKLEIGHLYTSPMGNNKEIYLGEMYSHIITKRYGHMVWYDKPKKVFVMLDPRYSGSLSIYDDTLKGKTLDDIFNILIANNTVKYLSNMSNVPMSICVLPDSIRLSKPSRYDTGIKFKFNGNVTLAKAVEEAQKWINQTNNINNTFRSNLIPIIGMRPDCIEKSLTDEEIRKITSYMPNYSTIEYHGVEYPGTRGK